MFEWKETYSTNIAMIDEQHKQLLKLGTELYEIVSLKDNADHYDEIIDILLKLKDYTIYHFESEEKLMDEYHVPGVETHKKQHAAFINKLNKLDKEDIDYNQSDVTMDLLIFIADWITQHILKTDHMYKDFLNEKGVC
jgi:hemerythrin